MQRAPPPGSGTSSPYSRERNRDCPLSAECWPCGGGDHERGRLGGLHRVVEEQPVETDQDLVGLEALPGQQPQPGAGEPGDDGGLGAAALDVAEDEAPAIVGAREDVVEVTPDDPVVAGLVDEGADDARYVGDLAGQQSALEDAADGGLPGVGAGRADGEADPAYEVLDERGDLVGDAGDVFAAEEYGSEGAAARGDPVGERDAFEPVRLSVVLGAAGPRDRHGSGADPLGKAERVALQQGAERLDAGLVDVPDLGEAGDGRAARGLGFQPDRAPVGEPGHE